MSAFDFSSLELNADLISNLQSLGYKEMTHIQSQSLPLILANKDLIGQAKTGSGKTAAFGLGIIQKLNVKLFKAQSIVLCPTRELASQVSEEIRRLSRTTKNIKVLTLSGGTPFGPQVGSLKHGAHVIVGTPGRVEEHLRKGTLETKNINTFVLDEADRMLDMGFKDTIDKIIDSMPLQRQTILFSATFPDQISLIVDRVMKSPVRVATDSVDSDNAIQQFFYMASNDDERMTALRLLISKHKLQSVLVFCNTKIDVKRVTSELINYGYYAIAIHGDMDQKDRDQALIRFSNNSISILVATDVAARGLDIDSLDMVINFSVANDPETHIHRIGRTGRAGRSGVACTLYDQREKFKLNALKLDIDFDKFSDKLPNIKNIENSPISPKMTTLKIDGGKRQKLRAGDIVGALTGSNGGVPGDRIGKINITSNWSYVAVSSELAKQALKKISNDNLKGRSFRVRIL